MNNQNILPVLFYCRYPARQATSIVWVHRDCAEHFQIKVAKNLCVLGFRGGGGYPVTHVIFEGHSQHYPDYRGYPVLKGKLGSFKVLSSGGKPGLSRRWWIRFPSILHVRDFPAAIAAMLSDCETTKQIQVYGPSGICLDDRSVRSDVKVSVLQELELSADGSFPVGTTIVCPVISWLKKP